MHTFQIIRRYFSSSSWCNRHRQNKGVADILRIQNNIINNQCIYRTIIKYCNSLSHHVSHARSHSCTYILQYLTFLGNWKPWHFPQDAFNLAFHAQHASFVVWGLGDTAKMPAMLILKHKVEQLAGDYINSASSQWFRDLIVHLCQLLE